jgi:hypothetical protein
MESNTYPRRQSTLIERIAFALIAGLGTVAVLMTVLTFIVKFGSTAWGLGGLACLAVGAAVFYLTPGWIVRNECALAMREMEKSRDLGKARNPKTKGEELHALLQKYPDNPEMIEAVFANPNYNAFVRGEIQS